MGRRKRMGEGVNRGDERSGRRGRRGREREGRSDSFEVQDLR